MASRARSVVEAELAHVHFLLDELTRWDASEVPQGVRRFLSERYERQARILLAVLTETPAEGGASVAPASVAVVEAAAPMGEGAVAVGPVMAAAEVREAATSDAVVPADVVSAVVIDAKVEVAPDAVAATAHDPHPSPLPEGKGASAGQQNGSGDAHPGHLSVGEGAPSGQENGPDYPHPVPLPAGEGKVAAQGPRKGRQGGAGVPPLPPDASSPFIDPPAPKGLTVRIVEESSTWSRLWRPFLYESIAWFIGAFLILSGTLYFVFESWAGMTSVTRSLVVFLMTAGYSTGFSIWGAFLSRRESLRTPGHILGLIGSAVAPLGGLALGPMGLGEALQLDGVSPVLLVPLLFGWAGVAAVLARKPTEAFDAPSRPLIQASLVGATLMMGLAPLAARLGAPAVWLNALPCALFFLLSRRPTPEPRKEGALAFVLTAPLFLTAVFAVRLHLALSVADASPSPGTYAPFAAFLLATCLRFRTLDERRAADALSIGAVSLQVACLAAAITGSAPAFFATAAVFTWTLLALARGPVSRLPWLYPAYVGAYLAYASSAQLVPGVVRTLINAVKVRMGYPPSVPLPFQYSALTALPFVLAGLVLAARMRWRGERTGDARDTGLADVLLRATTVAIPGFTLIAHMGADSRPAFWAALGLCVLGVAAGLLLEHFALCVVSAIVLVVFLPFSATAAYGAGAASVVCGVLALALAGVCTLCTKRTRNFFGPVVGVMAGIVFLLSVVGASGPAAVVGLALAGAAALVAAWALRNEPSFAFAAFIAAATLPKLAVAFSAQAVAPALAVVALGLAVLGERGGLLKKLGVPAVLYAVVALPWGMATDVPALGLVVLTSTAAVAVASRTFPWVRPLAVVMGALALLPDMPHVYLPWGGWMSPGLSLSLLILGSLAGSLAAVRWGRSPSTLTAGIVSLLFPLVPVAVARGSQVELFLVGAALAALFTARSLHPAVSVAVAALDAACGVYESGPVALLALAALLSVLAVLEEVPVVFRAAAGGRRFSLVATLSATAVLAVSTVRWDDQGLPLLMAGVGLLPLLWTRATKQPFFASLMVPYALVGILVVGHPPAWVAGLPLLVLLLVRAVEHLPAASLLLLRSTEENPRHALSAWMQAQLAFLGSVLLLTPWTGPGAVVVVAASLALLPGPRPSLRVCGAAALLLFVPEARPATTVLLLALGFVEHHAPAALWAFFRAPPDKGLRGATVVSALVLAAFPALETPSPVALLSLGGVVLVSAFLLSQRWLLTAAVGLFALAPLGQSGAHALGEWRPEAGPLVVGVALAAALLAAVCQSGGVQRALTFLAAKLTPGLDGTWSEPLWVGGAGVLAALLGLRLLDAGPGALPLPVAFLAGLTSLVLMVTRERWMANVATALLCLCIIAAVPLLWVPAVLSGAGLALCLAGFWLDARGVAVGAALHHGGWVLSLLSLAVLRDLKHPGTPLCLLFGLGSAWTVVLRRREREWVGWLASLVAAHGGMMHLAALYSTGRGSEFILPYFGAVSAALATLALLVASPRLRGRVGLGFAGVALTEVLMGLMLVDASGGAVREAVVSCAALTVLLFALVRRAAREGDEGAAWMAQAVLAVGYLSARLLGMGDRLGTADSLAALVGGALFNGLYVFVRREGAGLAAFRRPAFVGAFVFPVVGLLTAPWETPLVAAALLVGHAAHFAALATHPTRRGLASLASVAAFNTALVLVWLGTGAGEPQFYVIPAGLSVLALLRVFRGSVEADAYARLRALAITVIYVAGAWKPLMFSDGEAMLLCVFICLVGVGAGISLRIRSYVYLGTAFLVTCVAANLVRFGMRDHRVGAAFLSLLGLLVVGFMVVLSAHRAALLQRYERVRALLSTWEG